ncbi:HAD-IB family hydrolase [Algoriphagus aestuarii]|nr:HAD-IB family hydrolase [Algoriphagus aestuarii]
MSKKAVAFFDFDGTITDIDSFLKFLIYSGGYSKFLACLFVNSVFIILKLIGLYPNHRLKERFFSFFFKGKSEIEIKSLGKKFSEKVIPLYVYDSAKKLLSWHRQNQHEIVILTASSSLWLGEWAEINDFVLIGTEFEVQNGLFTGKIKGKNCYGIEKKNRIVQYLDKYPYEHRYAYGDSKTDTHYLELSKFSYLFPLTKKNVSEHIPNFK